MQALQESELRYATTLASIGDAVIASDVCGRINFMNAVAEDLTGWTLREASTKPARDVFKIINERTRQPASDIMARVLEEHRVLGLANHTVLIQKGGGRRPIDDTAAPITDEHGHVYPGATVPFGMVQLGPDTRLEGWDGCSGYHFDDERVFGFSHTHLSGTGVSDYGDILLLPATGTIRWRSGWGRPPGEGYGSRFRKATETASPGYYAVTLDDSDTRVELTTTLRAG